MNKREVLYVWPWQRLRISLDFADRFGILCSLERLEEYLESPVVNDSLANRRYRIVNLLAATSMGFNGRISLADKAGRDSRELKQLNSLIENFRRPFSALAKSDKHVDFVLQEDTVRLADLQAAYVDERAAFDSVYKDLHHRFHHGKGANVVSHQEICMRRLNRSELYDYLLLLDQCRGRRTFPE